MFRGLYGAILDALFPPKCVFCKKLLKEEEKDYCHECGKAHSGSGEVITGMGAFSLCVSALNYKDDVRKAFHRFKFGGKVNYASSFGRLMAEAIKNQLQNRYDIITWVPISARRKRNRGYDQAMLLAYSVALELDDVAAEVLRKVKDTQAQSNINDPSLRKSNIHGAYEIADPSLVKAKRVLLIDDIFTTGSTLTECSRVLLEAGAAEVVGAVFARSGR